MNPPDAGRGPRAAFASVDLKPHEFDRLAALVRGYCGINLHDGKKELVRARLGRRIAGKGFTSFAQYFRHVQSAEGAEEFVAMIDALSTNVTHFFREEPHFRTLARILAEMAGERGRGPCRLRLWSAACSSGEEPYSMAITALEALRGLRADVRILATDISTRVLEKAEAGLYEPERLKGVPPERAARFFEPVRSAGGLRYRVRPEARELVVFRRFNLMEPFPAIGPIDVVFCRNVMIYFDRATVQDLLAKFRAVLSPGGYLFVGHSESLHGAQDRFRFVEPAVYRK